MKQLMGHVSLCDLVQLYTAATNVVITSWLLHVYSPPLLFWEEKEEGEGGRRVALCIESIAV